MIELCCKKTAMYKICENHGEYTMYICKHFTLFQKDFSEICRIFICVFIAYTWYGDHILSPDIANEGSDTMENQREKQMDLSKIDWKKAALLALGALVVLLVILLCISISMRSHIQNKYANAREEIGEMAYTELYMLCQSFDQVSVPGVDVEDGLIPDMREYYLAAKTLNNVLVQCFGEKFGVLTEENLAAMDAAFEAYDVAFRAGKATDDAQAAMQSCVDMVRAVLTERFNDGSLLPG